MAVKTGIEKMFDGVKEGSVSQEQFEEWVRGVKNNSYNEGHDDGEEFERDHHMV